MGSVFQRKGRKGWYVEYTDARDRVRQHRVNAATKTEARRLLMEIERGIERQRLGLEELPSDSPITVGELVRWWLKSKCGAPSRKIETSRLTKHVLAHELASIQMRHLTAADIEERLVAMEEEGSAPASVDHVRRKLRGIFSAARAAKRWTGPSPFDDAKTAPKKRRAQQRRYELLDPADVPLVLRHIAPQWRGPLATAIFTAVRKGELLALEKRDVDLERRLLTVGRSWERSTTKTDQLAVIPIAEGLVPYLQEAMESPGPLLFPRRLEGGGWAMHRRDVNLVARLRSAMGRAGLVEGWDHVCRRCKAAGAEAHTWRHADDEMRRCPACEMILWPRAIPPPIRWHDLRHTAATILLRGGAPLHLVQRLLRHTDPRTTSGTYGHLVAEDLRELVERLPGGRAPDNSLTREPVEKKPPKSRRKSDVKSGVSVAGDTGFEPVAFGSGGQAIRIGRGWQGVAAARKPLDLLDPEEKQKPVQLQTVAGRVRNFPDNSLTRAPAPHLSVREVAARLGVSTATIYGLIKRRELRSTRVSGAHRIHPADLEAYLSRGRRTP